MDQFEHEVLETAAKVERVAIALWSAYVKLANGHPVRIDRTWDEFSGREMGILMNTVGELIRTEMVQLGPGAERETGGQ